MDAAAPAGPGPGGELPVVMVPGMLCDAELWTGCRERLGLRVVDVELTDDSIPGMAGQILDVVPGRFALVGLSLGAIAAFEALRLAPDRVASLCAVSTNAGAPRAEQYRAWADQSRRTAQGGFEQLVRESILPTMFAAAPPAELAERFLAMARRVGPEAFRAQLAAQATRRDAFAVLARAECRTTVVGGVRDALCPPSFHRRIADAVRDARLVLLPQAGHLLPMEEPAVLARVLREHLTAAPAGAHTEATGGAVPS